jgi:ribosomal-protein-alanine N-acetyltransferase
MTMKIAFSPIDEFSAREISRWRYEPPYDLYNLVDEGAAVEYALEPQNCFYTLRNADGTLVGFCSFGEDGQVPGGDYSLEALDIGMGIRPDLTDKGRGAEYIAEVLDFARDVFAPRHFRVTIAGFNRRAQRVWQANGFHPIQTFTHQASGHEFMVFICDPWQQNSATLG